MGDRIVVRLRSGGDYSPDFYGHWCGLRAIRVMDALVKDCQFNGMSSLMCNFIVAVMGGELHPYSYYLYNHGEADGSADWDNYTWTFDLDTNTWSTTHPELRDRNLSIEEVERWLGDSGYPEGTENPFMSPNKKGSKSGKKHRKLLGRRRAG